MIQGPGDLSHAIMVAAHASRPYVDRLGRPIIRHALTVMLSVGETEAVPAVLHDVVEDTDATLDDLRAAGFKPEDVDAVDALTRRDGETYRDYVARAIAAGDRVRTIKFADLTCNLARLHQLPTDERKRLGDRYRLAQAALLDAGDPVRLAQRLKDLGTLEGL